MKIEERERSQRKGFMKKIKEAWDTVYDDKPISVRNYLCFLRERYILKIDPSVKMQ